MTAECLADSARAHTCPRSACQPGKGLTAPAEGAWLRATTLNSKRLVLVLMTRSSHCSGVLALVMNSLVNMGEELFEVAKAQSTNTKKRNHIDSIR